MRLLLPLLIAYCLCLTGCIGFGAFKKLSVEFKAVSSMMPGQSIDEDEVVMIEGQTMAIRVQVIQGSKEKNWGSKESSLDPNIAGVHETTEKNVYVITAYRPGDAEVQFRIKDRRWYTVRKEYLKVKVLKRPAWTPTEPEPDNGAGGSGGASAAMGGATASDN